MKQSLLLKSIFYTVLLAAAVALGLLIQKNTNKTIGEAKPPQALQPEVSPQACMITIDGQKYDVQPLRSIHPGGDIYKCDTDMSQVFHGKHGESVKRIEKYLVK